MKKRERLLFLSIWILLAIGVGIYQLWPKSYVAEAILPNVKLGKELNSILSKATVVKESPSQYILEVTVQPSYLKQIGNTQKELQIRFNYESRQSVLGGGKIPLHISRQTKTIPLGLNNPDLLRASKIHLFLAP